MTEGADKDIAKDGLLAIAPRDPTGRPTLGGIPLYKKLGQGGMGAVYLGKHPRLGVEVAVKILPFHLADQDPNAIEYFMREANVAARLNHPSLVRIFDVNVDGDPKAGSAIWYLVMEFVSGQTAGRLMKDRMKGGRGPLAEADALDILMTVSDGLAAAHEQKFIHRDIKPDNIILPAGPDGEPSFRKAKLMDLGLAKVHSEDLSMGPTGTNVAMGTPGYMAPEQAENAKGAGPPADVFAMGATLYSLLTGSAPFTGTTILNVLKKTSDEAHVSIRKLNPAVSRPTEVLIDTCLAKRPEARYASAGVLREALKACRQSVAGEAPPDATLASLQNLASLASNDATVRAPGSTLAPSIPPGPGPTALTPEAPTVPVPGARRSSKASILIAALLFLAAAGVGGYFILKPGPPKNLPDTGSTDVDQLLRDADAALAEEDYEKAANLYAAALQKNPKSGAAADGKSRAGRLREEDSSSTGEVREAEELKKAGDAEGAWRRIRSGIEKYPHSVALRLWAGAFALEHDSYPWLLLAIDDVQMAAGRSRRRKPQADQLLQKLTEKKKRIAEAGGVLPEIQAAIDKGDWDAAEKLLDKVKAGEREGFAAAIAQGRKWKAAVDRGKQAEAAGKLGEAVAAYKESQAFRADSETDRAIQRIEKEIGKRYDAECDRATEKARAGKFAEAREHLAAAERLMPAGRRHDRIREDVAYLEPLAEARRLKAAGKNGEALAAARKALEIRKDSEEAKALVDQLQKEGPLSLAKAALAAGDRPAAVRHARDAAAHGSTPDLKALEAELWADLYVEKAAAPAKGPVDELLAASDGRIVGIGAGFGSFSVWEAGTLKPQVSATPAGSKPHNPVLVEGDELRVAGLAASPGPDGPEQQPVLVWEAGRSRALQIDVAGSKFPMTATRLAPFDANVVLRIRWTPGDSRSGPDVYTLDFLDVDGSTAREPIPARAQAHASIAVSPTRKHFATGGGIYRTWKREGARDVVDERKGDPCVYLWNRDLTKRPVDLGEPAGEGALLAFLPDGSKLLVATAAKKVFVIDVESARVDGTLPLPEPATSLAASASHVASVAGRRVYVARLSDSKVAVATGLASARAVLFSAQGDSLYVGGDDGVLRRYAHEPLAK